MIRRLLSIFLRKKGPTLADYAEKRSAYQRKRSAKHNAAVELAALQDCVHQALRGVR